MTQYLPERGLKWLNEKEINKFDVNSVQCHSIGKNSSDGYKLEVDLEYLDEIKGLHNDYLLAPEKTLNNP